MADIPVGVSDCPRERATTPARVCPRAPSSCPTTPAPPAGHGPHLHFVVVHALAAESIGVPAEATPAFLGFNIAGHILARAVLTATAEIPAA
ncbi:YbhB/YbcL family Raf kinase inhibitor-like protein [Streptomyces sp. NPDC005483]|uniref:YbhB/YbcL family Raf kinase inhibitor-like protein n=1 Tax=Streptomyces sp. NPDC005483 TaxID=3154882 RepID=UPI0033BC79C7